MIDEYFSESFLDTIPDDPLMALATICKEFRKFDNKAKQTVDLHQDYLSAVAIFQAIAQLRNYSPNPPIPAAGSDAQANINNLRAFFFQNEADLIRQLNTAYIERETRKYTDRFEINTVYVFADDDVITPKHKSRLLERLERLQRELHKKTSDLDSFWRFIGEAGIAIGRFGNDIKPFVDRVRELSDIIGKAIKITEKLLPSYSPMMLPPNASDDSVAT
jgi:hypothetical protein